MKKISKTIIKTSLPYCLFKVDTRFFKLGDEYNSKIRFKKIETTPNRRTQYSRNVEVIRDRWGIDAFSDVEIYTDKEFNIQEEHEKIESFSLQLINKFIKIYRYYDKDSVHLIPLIKEDLFTLNASSNGHFSISMMLSGGMTVANPLLNHEFSNKIEQSIKEKQEISFWEELMLNAEQYRYQTEYRHSILESVIAVELVVSEFIRKKCKEKGIKNEDANGYIRTYGLTGNIQVTLPLLLDKDNLPEDEIIKKCKASIEIRNKIVHRGEKNVTEVQAKDSIKFGQQMIDFLLKEISK